MVRKLLPTKPRSFALFERSMRVRVNVQACKIPGVVSHHFVQALASAPTGGELATDIAEAAVTKMWSHWVGIN